MGFFNEWLGRASKTLPKVQELADTDLQIMIMDTIKKSKTANEQTINDVIERETGLRIDTSKLVKILDVLNILGLISIRVHPVHGREYELVPRGVIN